jgi:hypothetical protein
MNGAQSTSFVQRGILKIPLHEGRIILESIQRGYCMVLEFGVWNLEFGWSFLRQLAKLNENIPVQFAILISGCKGC